MTSPGKTELLMVGMPLFQTQNNQVKRTVSPAVELAEGRLGKFS